MLKMQIVLSTLALTFAGVAAVSACYVAGNSTMCCKTRDTKCENPEFEGVVWTCEQTSNAAGFSLTTVRPWQASDGPGAGQTSAATGTPRGSCQIQTRTCGALPGECNLGAIINVQCNDTVTSGASCPAGQ